MSRSNASDGSARETTNHWGEHEMSNKTTKRAAPAKTRKTAAAAGRKRSRAGECTGQRGQRARAANRRCQGQTQEAVRLVAPKRCPYPRAKLKPRTRERSNGNDHRTQLQDLRSPVAEGGTVSAARDPVARRDVVRSAPVPLQATAAGRRGNAAGDLRRRARRSARSARRSSTSRRLYGIASLWRGRARERDGLEALAIAPAM